MSTIRNLIILVALVLVATVMVKRVKGDELKSIICTYDVHMKITVPISDSKKTLHTGYIMNYDDSTTTVLHIENTDKLSIVNDWIIVTNMNKKVTFPLKCFKP